ncbi:MAG: Gfo/Idh/MocA family protein [Chitinophagales bacterium]
MNSQYKFAIIGCGQIAVRHAEQIKKNGQLIAVCDIIKEKADLFSKNHAANAYYDIDDLLANEKEIDIISVCTPNGLHALHSIKSLKAGKHVLCEKPMAINSSDANQMIRTEKLTGKKLFVVKQNRYNPPVVLIKKLVDEKKLGQIFNFQVNCFWNRPASYYKNSWKGTKELDGGILFTQFSHFIDLLYWLLGDVASAKGVRKNFLHKNCIEFEDTGVAFLEMKSGSVGTIHYTINTTNKNMEGSITLFGEKGTIKIGGQYLNELEYFSVEGESRPLLPEGKPANQYGFYEGSMSNHDKVYEHLLKALKDPEHSFINSEETLKTIEIIEKIYNSSPLLP